MLKKILLLCTLNVIACFAGAPKPAQAIVRPATQPSTPPAAPRSYTIATFVIRSKV